MADRAVHTAAGRAALRSARSIRSMRLILLLALAAPALRADSACETVSVSNKPHKKEVLAGGLNRPYQLSMYKREHKIFFSYNVGKYEEDTFEIGYIERGKPNVTVIEGVTDGFASAVDEQRRQAYLGGAAGVFRYHLDGKKREAPETVIGGHNIWYMFFKEHLYFIDYPSQKLYKYNASEGVPEHQEDITEKIYQFVIDKDGDRFITNASGLYALHRGERARTRYAEGLLFRGAALDNDGVAYFCGDHSIYVPNKTKHTLEPIATVRNIFGITFDAQNNIIYADPDKIIKLLPGKCK